MRGLTTKRFSFLLGVHDSDAIIARFAGVVKVGNTLPIRRLALHPGESQEISVVYISFPDLQLKAVRQRYTCLKNLPNGQLYRYEGLLSGFTAEIEVDKDGLVMDYPGVFRKV